MKTFNKLCKSGIRWIDELPAVLWSIRTTPNRATAQTPFALVYGQKQFSPRNSYTGYLERSLMTSLSKSSCPKRMQRSLRKIVFGLLCVPLATSRPCAAIIAARFTPEALRKVTLFFGGFNSPRIQTS